MSEHKKTETPKKPINIRLIIIGVAAAILAMLLLTTFAGEKNSNLDKVDNIDNSQSEVVDTPIEESSNPTDDGHNHEDESMNPEEMVPEAPDDGSIEFNGNRIYPESMFSSSEPGKLVSVLASSLTPDELGAYTIDLHINNFDKVLSEISNDAIHSMAVANNSEGKPVVILVRLKGSNDVAAITDKLTSMNFSLVEDSGIFVYGISTEKSDETARVMGGILEQFDKIQLKEAPTQ